MIMRVQWAWTGSLVGLMLVASACTGADGSSEDTVLTDGPASWSHVSVMSTPEPSPDLEKLWDCPSAPGENDVHEEDLDALPQEGDRVRVVGPECVTGTISYEEMFGGGANRFAPVIGDDGEIMGYWYQRWFTLAQYEEVEGDPEAAIERYGSFVEVQDG